jgi:hypothetical protein
MVSDRLNAWQKRYITLRFVQQHQRLQAENPEDKKTVMFPSRFPV